MNPFVNLKKRSIQLPKGAKDLIEVLRKRDAKPKCEYCGAAADRISIAGETFEQWCVACTHDLADFAANQHLEFIFDLEELERKQAEFMRQRVKERKVHDAA